MNIHTHFEDLSNEIFFEIFDYLDAFEIFTGFTSLNQRISSILQSIPLRIFISDDYSRHQIDFLSSYLTFHAHQVISLQIHDTIRDYSSVISLLFNRHNFINLQSCIFLSINSPTKFPNVLKQIQNLNRLVTFGLIVPCLNINEKDKSDLARIIFMHKSSSLRSVILQYCYDYFDISNYTSISSNIQSLNLRIHGTHASIHSLLFIFRVCHGIRHLGLTVEREHSIENNHVNVPIRKLSLDDNDYPLLPQLISFDFVILVMCDIYLIAYLLHCMPNLNRFDFLLTTQMAGLPYYLQLFNGYVWQQILTRYVPCLSKFEFHILITKTWSNLNLNYIVNSFKYFVQKYPNWNMVIDRWRCLDQTSESVILRTLDYNKYRSNNKRIIPHINSQSYETRSIMTINDHYLFYSDIRRIKIYLAKIKSTVTWSSPLYKNIHYLTVQMPTIPYSSLWNQLLKTITFHQTTDDDDDAQQNVTYLSHFVHLPNINVLEFASESSVHQWKSIQLILQACSNVNHIIISTRLLMSSKLIDNPSLISIFEQIKTIKSLAEKIYFPSNFASKLVQRFPSLLAIDLHVLSFDNCVDIINIFLTYFENLSYVKIHYSQETLLDDPFSCNYIIEKRRQSFPANVIDEKQVIVKNNGEAIEIWLK